MAEVQAITISALIAGGWRPGEKPGAWIAPPEFDPPTDRGELDIPAIIDGILKERASYTHNTTMPISWPISRQLARASRSLIRMAESSCRTDGPPIGLANDEALIERGISLYGAKLYLVK